MKPSAAIIAGLVISLSLLIGVTLVGGIEDTQSFGAQDRVRDAALLEADGQFVEFEDAPGVGQNETVFQTTGFAGGFTGANDSELSQTGAFDLTNDTSWQLSVWAEPDAGVTGQLTVATISDGEVVIYYDAANSEWVVWYYRQDTRNSYEATVATNTPRNGLTNIQAVANDTFLKIVRNGTVGGETDITTDTTTTLPDLSNWDGRVEELRTFSSVNASARTALRTEPTEQLPQTNRSARIMFDQPDRSRTLILLTGQTATKSNMTRADGFPADQMQIKSVSNDIAGTSDYRFESDGPRIAPTSGGELSGAPVAYANYSVPASGVSPTSLVDWMSVAAILPLLLIAAAILSRLR